MTTKQQEQLREELSKILIKWSMSTRQAAINEILSLFAKREEEILTDFSEFCHTRYTGCQKRENKYDEWEYCYKNEVIFMAHDYIKQRSKEITK